MNIVCLASICAYEGQGSISAFQIASRFGASNRAITSEIDDVAIYNTALSPEEMAFLSENPAVVETTEILEVVSTAFVGETFEVQAANLAPGSTYCLTRTADLSTEFEEQVGEPLTVEGNSATFVDPSPMADHGFYRVEKIQ